MSRSALQQKLHKSLQEISDPFAGLHLQLDNGVTIASPHGITPAEAFQFFQRQVETWPMDPTDHPNFFRYTVAPFRATMFAYRIEEDKVVAAGYIRHNPQFNVAGSESIVHRYGVHMIVGLSVHPDYRNRGFGTEIIKTLMEQYPTRLRQAFATRPAMFLKEDDEHGTLEMLTNAMEQAMVIYADIENEGALYVISKAFLRFSFEGLALGPVSTAGSAITFDPEQRYLQVTTTTPSTYALRSGTGSDVIVVPCRVGKTYTIVGKTDPDVQRLQTVWESNAPALKQKAQIFEDGFAIVGIETGDDFIGAMINAMEAAHKEGFGYTFQSLPESDQWQQTTLPTLSRALYAPKEPNVVRLCVSVS